MKTLRLTACLLLPLLFLGIDPVPARAATVNLVNASGAVAGSYSTIQSCVNNLQPGYTCDVMPGTYPERVTFQASHSGDGNGHITVKAHTPRTVLMDGFDTQNANYLRIEGFDITGGPVGGWLSDNAIQINNSDHIEVVNNYIYDYLIVGIGGSGTNITVSNNLIVRAAGGIWVSGANWLIENNEVNELYDWSAQNGVHHLDDDYARFFGDNITFKHNYFHGTVFNEITYFWKDWATESIRTACAGDTNCAGGWCEAGFCKSNSHVDCFQTFDNNGEHVRNIIFDGNYCESFHQGLMGEASFHRNSSGLLFRNNVFNGGSLGGAWGLAVVDIQNVTVVNNVFAHLVYHGVGFSGISSGLIQNNIFYDAGSNYWHDATATFTGGFNIISPAGYPYYAEATDLVDVDPQFTNGANLLGPDNKPFTGDDGYRLMSTSPAINAGTPLPALVTADIYGTYRPQDSGYDIGAVEYCAAGCVSAPANQGEPAHPRVFPNPWRADQASGSPRVTFDNLVGNCQIKIYSASGHLVRTLPNAEGTAEWNLQNDAGQLVASGVYLYLVTDGYGNLMRGKVSVIR